MANEPERKRASRHWFLREWRQRQGRSLMDLGAEVGISHGQLSKMERDAHPFTIAQAQRLADALGMNWTTLLHIDPRDPAGSMRDLLEADQVNTRAFGEYLADEAARYRAPPSEDRVAWHLQDIPPRPPRPRNGR